LNVNSEELQLNLGLAEAAFTIYDGKLLPVLGCCADITAGASTTTADTTNGV
jgi:hypothetical protein